MKKVLALVFVAALAAVACKKDKAGRAAEAFFNENAPQVTVTANSIVLTAYLEIEREGRARSPYLRLTLTGGSGLNPIYIYFPTEKSDPLHRKIESGYSFVDVSQIEGAITSTYAKGVIRVSSEGGETPRYTFISKNTDGVVSMYQGTPEDDSFPAGTYYDESHLHFPASSFVEASYLSAGSVGGEADYDCFKIDFSNVHEGGHVDFSLMLLVNEAFSEEFRKLPGTYELSNTPGDHIWKYGAVVFYNEWGEETFRDMTYPMEGMKTAKVTACWDYYDYFEVKAKCPTLLNLGVEGGSQPLEIDETNIPYYKIKMI